jgi:hypothetical protein
MALFALIQLLQDPSGVKGPAVEASMPCSFFPGTDPARKQYQAIDSASTHVEVGVPLN